MNSGLIVLYEYMTNEVDISGKNMKGYRMMKKWTKLLLCCVMVMGIDTFCFGNQANTRQVVIYSDSSEGPIGFAVRQVSEALIEKGYNVADRPLDEFSRGSEQARIILTVRAKQRIETRLEERGRKPIGTLEPQGYAVRMIRNSTCLVVGADEVGAMYGGLEVAELIRIGELKNIRDVVRKPSIQSGGLSSIFRWMPEHRATTIRAMPLRKITLRCGTSSSGKSFWITWPFIAITP